MYIYQVLVRWKGGLKVQILYEQELFRMMDQHLLDDAYYPGFIIKLNSFEEGANKAGPSSSFY